MIFSALIPFNIPIVSGNIIAATAVLLIHMERNVVAVKRYVIESFKFPLKNG